MRAARRAPPCCCVGGRATRCSCLLPFGSLVVADVLLYSLALSSSSASLVRLRRSEPALRGAFRIPVGADAVTALAVLPMLVLLLVVVLSFCDGEYGVPAVLGAAVAIALGPITFRIAARRKLVPASIDG